MEKAPSETSLWTNTTTAGAAETVREDHAYIPTQYSATAENNASTSYERKKTAEDFDIIAENAQTADDFTNEVQVCTSSNDRTTTSDKPEERPKSDRADPAKMDEVRVLLMEKQFQVLDRMTRVLSRVERVLDRVEATPTAAGTNSNADLLLNTLAGEKLFLSYGYLEIIAIKAIFMSMSE